MTDEESLPPNESPGGGPTAPEAEATAGALATDAAAEAKAETASGEGEPGTGGDDPPLMDDTATT